MPDSEKVAVMVDRLLLEAILEPKPVGQYYDVISELIVAAREALER